MTQSQRRARARRMSGASLVELMVVVGIITAISAMAVANMPRLSRDMRIGRAAHTYAGVLREARGRALANRAFMRVKLTSTQLRLEECNCGFGTAVSCCAVGNDAAWLPGAVRVYSMTGDDFRNVSISGALSTVFTPRGLLQSGSGAVTFGSTIPGPTIKQKVVINATGWVEKQ